MSLAVVFRETALRNLARIRSVDDEAGTVYIINIGIMP
jgi:hypothetical protein